MERKELKAYIREVSGKTERQAWKEMCRKIEFPMPFKMFLKSVKKVKRDDEGLVRWKGEI